MRGSDVSEGPISYPTCVFTVSGEMYRRRVTSRFVSAAAKSRGRLAVGGIDRLT
jgi:hypothetical protein